KRREAPLKKEAFDLIQQWLKERAVESKYIFTHFDYGVRRTPTADPISTVSLWRMVQKYAHKAGIANIKPHDFRRFVGLELVKKDPHQAQKALGHKYAVTTRKNYSTSKE